MTDQTRTSRVLIALIVSMTIGAVVLMALDNGAVDGREAFSLSLFKSLPGEDLVMKPIDDDIEVSRWGRIEVFYSNTTSSGTIKELSYLKKLDGEQGLDAHFVVFNGANKADILSEVKPTEQWKQQQASLSRGAGTIRICVVANGINNGVRVGPNDNQVLHTNDLVEILCTEFNISDGAGNIVRPASWQ